MNALKSHAVYFKFSMMKVLALFLFICTAFCIVSCEKVIDVQLKDASPLLVIEGIITNRTDSQYVKINQSVPFGESNTYPEVSNAVVTIQDGTGRVFTLRERRPGFYMARNFVAHSGRTYKLKVEYEGKEYTASSTMPQQVNIDSLGVSVSSFFGEEQRTVQILFNDPPATKNYYRFLLRVNGLPSKRIFVFDDNFTNGKKVSRELFDLDLSAKSGDKAEIEMQCIDQVIYRYWQGLDQNENRGGASTTPANPVSNISNGALGYFSAHTKQNEKLIIP
ncbi:MAG: DUF4249 domain-containing protein [Pyrinomonadaceae bacterium]|nr:DUF4249 domain-containing protein [Sphingobacteriaceae bacterium]